MALTMANDDVSVWLCNLLAERAHARALDAIGGHMPFSARQRAVEAALRALDAAVDEWLLDQRWRAEKAMWPCPVCGLLHGEHAPCQ